MYSSIFIVPLNSRGPTEVLLVRLAPRKGTSFKRDKDIERLEDKKEDIMITLRHYDYKTCIELLHKCSTTAYLCCDIACRACNCINL